MDRQSDEHRKEVSRQEDYNPSLLNSHRTQQSLCISEWGRQMRAL